MVNKAVAISREKLEDTLVTWDSITTADGAVGCTSLIDAGLIGKNDFVTNQVTVLILGGNSNLEKQVAATFNSGTGTITFTAMSHRILSGTPYRLINFGAVSVGAIQATILSDATPFPGADIALIQAKTTNLPASPAASGEAAAALAVPAADANTNVLERDVIGNKADAAVTTVGVVASIIAYIKGLLNQIALIKTRTDNLLGGSDVPVTTASTNWYASAQTVCTVGVDATNQIIEYLKVDLTGLTAGAVITVTVLETTSTRVVGIATYIMGTDPPKPWILSNVPISLNHTIQVQSSAAGDTAVVLHANYRLRTE